MGRLRRKRMHKPTKDVKKKYRTRRRTKDLDQIHQDLKPENREKLLKQDENVDLPGLGHYYCVECARYFVTEVVLTRHQESKLHKKRYGFIL